VKNVCLYDPDRCHSMVLTLKQTLVLETEREREKSSLPTRFDSSSPQTLCDDLKALELDTT
jgi:hypothetical protein